MEGHFGCFYVLATVNDNFTQMWDVKLKATSEQTRHTNEQKLIDTDNSMVVARGKGCGSGKEENGPSIW